MEIDITSFVRDANPYDFSGSIAERGPDAAKGTWGNALTRARAVPPPILSDAKALDAFRDHMRGFGAWGDEEIDAWSEQECNALFIQLISGDMREAGMEGDLDDFDWRAYERDVSAGRVAGNIFKTDDSRVFYYVGN